MILINPQNIPETAERLLTVTDVTIIGVLMVVILLSWVVIFKVWQANVKLNTEIRGFIEKYYVISTKVLSHLSSGRDV